MTGNVSDRNTQHSLTNKNVKSKTSSKPETNMALHIDQVTNNLKKDETLDFPNEITEAKMLSIAVEKSIELAQQEESEMKMIETALQDSLKLVQDEDGTSETNKPKEQ